jgi:glycosyltransferase involved in cell wall biosynthesis
VNVLLVNYEYPPVGGGGATASREIARTLVARGHRVAVLTSSFGNLPAAAEEDGIAVRRVGRRRARVDRSTMPEMASFLLAAWLRAPALARELSIDGVVAFFSVPCGPVALRLNRKLGIPYVVSLRGGDVPGHVAELVRLHRLWRPWRRRVLQRAVAVVANSPSLATFAGRADGRAVEVVPNGVDSAFFTPAEISPNGPFRLLFVGRLHPQKNPAFFVSALAALRRRTSLSFAADVVGDGRQAASLRDQAARLGVADAITWRGWVDHRTLREHYRAAHCFISPSPREGMPNAVVEAMACGLPVLASRVPGHDDVVRHGATGYLFGLDDVDDFIRHVELLMTDRGLRARLGACAREWAASEFSWDRAARAYLAYLERGVATAAR